MESDTNGRRQNARYGVDGLRTKKQDTAGNSSREYGVGISTSASTPLTQSSTAPSISYISGPMILGAEIDGEFVYHLGDALSTVRDVVDSSGNVIRSNEWDEYGNLISSSGSGQASPKTWVGGLSVNDDTADSKLYNMGHRNYAGGVLGRFISRDPIGFAGGLNLYSYTVNPVTYVDPEGLKFKVNDYSNSWPELKALLTELTGYQFKRDANGMLSIVDRDNFNCEGTSGDARQLLRQMIDSNALVTLDLMRGIISPAGNPGQGRHGLDVADIRNQTDFHRALGLGNLGHELSEAYAMAKGSGFHAAHQEGIRYENLIRQNLGSDLVRPSSGDKVLEDPNGKPYGAIIDYGSQRCRYTFGSPSQGKYPNANLEFIP